MSEEKKPKKKSSASPKEHKPSWQAKYATPEEIQQMLSQRVLLRYNEVRHRTEVHWLSQGPVIGEDEQGLLTIFGGDGGVTDGYENLTEYDVNTLWRKLCREKPVVKQHLQNVIESDYVPKYHPFRYYLERLQRHNEQFEAPNMECELIDQYFRKPAKDEVCEELPASVILQVVGANVTAKLSTIMLGRALVELGYRYRLVHGCRRYQVVRRSADEMRLMRQTRSGGDGGDGGADS